MKFENKEPRKTIVVVCLSDILRLPPVIHLVDNLLNNGHKVHLVGCMLEKLPQNILDHTQFSKYEVSLKQGTGLITSLYNRFIRGIKGNKAVKEAMKNADILWTTTDGTVKILGKTVQQYRHVMQLMEMEEWLPVSKYFPFIRFPIDKYAQRAWKVVVPEINRAYIQQAWWDIKNTPYVLPNKPYRIEAGEPTTDMMPAIEKIKNEKRKIILYLGLLNDDRSLDAFAEAVNKLGNNYCMYIVGSPTESYKDNFKKLMDKYPFIENLGFFPSPKHLHFVPYANIGLLPYVPKAAVIYRSKLNALYCAPNKIFEYAGFGVPMIGTDVLGLRQPFEQYNIGFCCKNYSPDTIIDAIHKIEQHHDEMSANCKKFYDSVDLDQIVEDILYEEV